MHAQVGETLRACESLQVNEEGTRVKRAAELDPEAAVKGVDELTRPVSLFLSYRLSRPVMVDREDGEGIGDNVNATRSAFEGV